MTRKLLPVSGWTVNPASEVAAQVIGIVEFLEIDLPTGNLYLTNAHQAYTFGGNTYLPAATSGLPFGSVTNFNEGTDAVPRPMRITLSGVDQTQINNIVGNDITWATIVWSMGFLDKNNNLLNGTPFLSAPLFLGDCTITLGKNTGTIEINAENLLADMQKRQSGCLQTVQDQRSRGAPGNSTFINDTFYEYCASLTYVFTYWGMNGPSRLGIGSGQGLGFGGAGGGSLTTVNGTIGDSGKTFNTALDGA